MAQKKVLAMLLAAVAVVACRSAADEPFGQAGMMYLLPTA
jgi:hypothetical protein